MGIVGYGRTMPQALPPPIIITAPRLADPAAERAFGVERIGADRLANAPSTQLDQLLKEVPGIQLFRRSDARSSHPTSQGVTLRALGGNAASRALLILDGVPQSDPFGGWVNWPAYEPAGLAEVRVVRGGGSVAHGPGALAGTIEMVGKLAPGAEARIEGGSRESVEAGLNAGGAVGGGTFGISARAGRGDGFVPIAAESRGPIDRAAPYAQASGRAQWVVPVTGETRLQATVSGFHDKRDRGVPFTGNRSNGADASLRLVADGRWSALGYVQWRHFESGFASVNAERTAAAQASLQDEVPSHAVGGSVEYRPPTRAGVELRVGVDFRRSAGETRELFSFVNGEATRRRKAGGETLAGGLFGEASYRLGRATLSAGARLDHWRISDGHLLERQIASGATLRDDRFDERSGWRPTARGGAVVDAGGGLDLRAAAYLGWRLPTLNELFRPFRAGADATAANAALDPERLAGAEIGAEYRRDGLRLSATLFHNRLQDAIANVTLGVGPGQFPGVGFVAGEYRQRRNLDAIEVRGAELSAELRSGAWAGGLGYSLTDAEVTGRGAAAVLDGLRPAQTPRHMMTARLHWDDDRRSASLVVRHVGGQFEDDLNQRLLPKATTVDMFGAWPVTSRLQLVARAENLLNERVVAGISGGDVVERATPRTLWLGLRLQSRSRSSGAL